MLNTAVMSPSLPFLMSSLPWRVFPPAYHQLKMLDSPVDRGQPDEPTEAEQIRRGHVREPVMAEIDSTRSHEGQQTAEKTYDYSPDDAWVDPRVGEVGEKAIDADIIKHVSTGKARSTDSSDRDPNFWKVGTGSLPLHDLLECE